MMMVKKKAKSSGYMDNQFLTFTLIYIDFITVLLIFDAHKNHKINLQSFLDYHSMVLNSDSGRDIFSLTIHVPHKGHSARSFIDLTINNSNERGENYENIH